MRNYTKEYDDKLTYQKMKNSRRVKVSPLEGIGGIFIIYIFLQTVFLLLTFVFHGYMSIVFWILFWLIACFETGMLYMRIASPWRRLHYPLMFRYAAVAGHQAAIAERENREFNINTAMNDFLRAIYPDWSDEMIERQLKTIDQEMNSFDDKERLRDFLKKHNTQINENETEYLLVKIQKFFKKKNPRWVIAKAVERDYGTEERIKYLYSAIIGKAK